MNNAGNLIHKTYGNKMVEAFEITEIVRLADGGARLVVGDDPCIVLDAKQMEHNPRVGAYWCRFEDGYQTACPRFFFEKSKYPDCNPFEYAAVTKALGLDSNG